MPLPLICLLAPLPALQAPAPASGAQTVLDAAKAKGKSVMEARAAWVSAGRNTKDFRGDCAKELAALEARLSTEKAPDVRQALLVSRLYLLGLAKLKPTPAALEETKREVPATAAAWTLDAGLLTARAEADPAAWGAYAAEARGKHPDAGVRRTLLFDHFLADLEAGDEPGARAVLGNIQTQFPGPLAQRTQAFLDAETKSAPGRPAPAFSQKALGDVTTTYTLETFKGRYLLLDFWATWCPDCRAELPAIHAAWARFQAKPLDLLSLSFDRRVEHIAAYRQEATLSMPWKHAFVEGGFQSLLAQTYGVMSIPRLVLIGPDGTLLASGAALRCPKLERTLEKFLGK